MSNTIVEALRQARDKMNHSGKHWIKGSEKLLIRIDEHEPGSTMTPVAYSPTPGYEPAFCSVGALKEVKAPTEAYIELAKLIDPKRMKEVYADVEVARETLDEDELYWAEQNVDEEAYDIIMGFNDDPKTTWQDVRDVFTRAARRVSQRKSVVAK